MRKQKEITLKVTYKDHFGSDNSVVDAARVSFSKEASGYTPEQNNKLIKYLAKHQHKSPFFHTAISLHLKMPIFVARQIMKHTTGLSTMRLAVGMSIVSLSSMCLMYGVRRLTM